MVPVAVVPVAEKAAMVTTVAAVAGGALLDHALLDHGGRLTYGGLAAAGVAAMTAVTPVLASGLDNRAAERDSKKHHKGQSNEPFHSLISWRGGLPAALPPCAILANLGVKLGEMLPVGPLKSTQSAQVPLLSGPKKWHFHKKMRI